MNAGVEVELRGLDLASAIRLVCNANTCTYHPDDRCLRPMNAKNYKKKVVGVGDVIEVRIFIHSFNPIREDTENQQSLVIFASLKILRASLACNDNV